MHQLKPFTLFVVIPLLSALPLSTVVTAQSCTAFHQLEDATGFQPFHQHQIDSLNAAACRLRAALPSAYQSDFAVYDLGFYSHHTSYEGGIPEILQETIEDLSTPYYLIFGREFNLDDELKRVWVEVELPEDEWLLDCFNQTYIQVFKSGIRNKAEEIFQQYTNPASHPEAKIQTISYIVEKLGELGDCCDPSGFRQQSCELCETTAEIYGWLMDHGFVGIEVENITYSAPVTAYNNIDDQAGVYLDGVSLAQLAHQTIGNIAALNNTTSTGYITDNSNFCTGIVDFVINEYATDLTNFDVWFHLWDDTLNSVQVLFVRADFYLLLDDPGFIEYYEEDGPPAFQAPPGRSQIRSQPETHYLIIDPETETYYYSDQIEPLPTADGPGLNSIIPSELIHTVKSGDNLTKIVEEWGNGFTIEEIIYWNSDKLEDENTILQIGWDLKLYNEAFMDILINEYHVWGYTVPILPIEYYNLIDADAHPDLKFIPAAGAPAQNFFKNIPKRRPLIKIPNPNGYGPVQDVIKDEWKWNYKKIFTTSAAKVVFRFSRAGVFLILDLVLTPQTVQDASLNYLWEWEARDRIAFHEKIKLEESKDKLTYATYTKYNPKAQNNAPLDSGKVYVGRTSGYNKNPLKLIALRDGAHKRDIRKKDYDYACYDHHEYSTTNSRATRHSDPAYKIIRGREQVIIENMGGAWSDVGKKATIKDTRSGNAINGIDKKKWPAFYVECKNMALNAAIILNPNNPKIDWIPPCEDWQQYWWKPLVR